MTRHSTTANISLMRAIDYRSHQGRQYGMDVKINNELKAGRRRNETKHKISAEQGFVSLPSFNPLN